MGMSANQKRQIEEARREAIENTHGVCADGEKHKYEEKYEDEINNE